MNIIKPFKLILPGNYFINAFVLGLLLFFGHQALAQDSVGVKLQPTIIEELVEPGQVFHSTLRVTNISDSDKFYYLVVRDIEGLSPNGSPIFVEAGDKTDYSLSSWIVFNQSSFTVGPNETKTIAFSAIVPKNAGPGGHFAGLFVSLKPPKPEATGTGVGYEVATIISLQVAGEINDQARIREFTTGKLIYTKAEVDFKTMVENSGNILVRARGPLEVTDMFGKKVVTLVVNDQGAVVLPNSTREFQTTWTGEGLSIGRYQAVLGLVYGGDGGKKTITATTSFWVLPLNFILVVLVGIVGFIVLFFTVAHLYIRRKLVKLGVGKEGSAHIRVGGGSSKAMIFSVAMLIAVAILIIFLMILFA